MKNAIIFLASLALASCSVGYSVVDWDDTYSFRHYDWNRSTYWGYDRFRPSPIYPYGYPYPQRDVIIVVPRRDYSSPRENRVPQQRPQMQGPRRGTRQN